MHSALVAVSRFTFAASRTPDIVQARQRFRYDFFQRAINEEAEVRQEMHRLFDRLLKK